MTDLEVAELRIQHLERELRKAQETLRDKFAMAVLASPLGCAAGDLQRISARVYEVADAMLEARNG